MNLELDGRVALVTGASVGIGRVVAEVLAAEGAHVVLCARRREVLEAAAEEIAKTVGTATPSIVVADMATIVGPAQAVAAAIEQHGRIDILVNNASDAPVGSLLTLAADELEPLFRAKPLGYLRACLAAVPAMQRQGGGVIINVAGISAKSVSPSSLTTIATTAVIGLTKALAEEVAPFGIRVVAVSPGPIRTPHLEQNFERFAVQRSWTPAEVEADMTAQIPLGRLGESIDVAETIAFLASDRASFITGTSVVVDGGKSRAVN